MSSTNFMSSTTQWLPGCDTPRELSSASSPQDSLVLDPAVARSVWQHLDAAARRLRQRPRHQLASALAAWAQDMRHRGPGPWTQALETSTGFTIEGLSAAWEVTFASVTPSALHRLLEAEDMHEEPFRQLQTAGRLPTRMLHVLPGNVFPPTLSLLLRGWLLGAAQWLRPSHREGKFALCLAHAAQDWDADLGESIAVCSWPKNSTEIESSIFSAVDVATIHGNNQSVREFSAQLATRAPETRCVGYGHRWSAAILSTEAQNAQTAATVALDVALFDQQGCLSPSHVFLQAGPRNDSWLQQFAEALESQQQAMPRGIVNSVAQAGLRHWRQRMRMRVALGLAKGYVESDGNTHWAVLLDDSTEIVDSPLDRHVVLVPFDDPRHLQRLYGDRLADLQGIGADLVGWRSTQVADLRRMLRPSCWQPLGQMQNTPLSWWQDNRPPLRSLLLKA